MTTIVNSTNRFGVAKWIVDPTAGNGTHTTISAALTSASSGDTIFIRTGTYTENLTLKAGVNLVGFSGDGNTPNVTIIGKLTASFAGTASISNIRLQTNSDNFLVVSGSSATVLIFNNCYLNCSNNTGISYTSSSSSSSITFQNCNGNLGTTGIGLYSSSSAGRLNFYYSIILNSGNSTTASSNSAGRVTLSNSNFALPLSTSSTGGITLFNAGINTSAINTTCLTHNGSANPNFCDYSVFDSGTASAISVGTGAALYLNGSCRVNSSNANVITGLGTINYTPIGFQSGSTVNTTTQTPLTIGPRIYTPTISFDSGSNLLQNYAEGTWTPTLTGGSTAGTTTYINQVGLYTRIGRQVTVYYFVNISAATGTGQIVIGGLPFTVKNTSSFSPLGACYTGSATYTAGYTYPIAQSVSNTTNILLYIGGSTQAVTALAVENAARSYLGTITYFV
jgi:hypothetical protein